MHIPDAFVPLWQSAIYWIVALIFVALALRWARNELSEDKIPLIAVLAAGIFAIQAFNLPVAMGTSGHLVGGALAAIVLGSPYAAVFILTLVLIIQGIIFGDGGITTMGANILNMGVIGGFVGFYGYTALKSAGANMYLSAGVAAWLACFIASLAAAVEMAVAGTFPLVPGLIAMGTYHAVIGIIEGVITGAIIYFLAASRPDLLAGEDQQPSGGGVFA
ncbi:MAG TPA: cobalt transporter CbiM [Methanoculleus sp.]|nr:cobalt transporter CbiM [Methanoculleus sp.]